MILTVWCVLPVASVIVLMPPVDAMHCLSAPSHARFNDEHLAPTSYVGMLAGYLVGEANSSKLRSASEAEE